MYCSEQEKLYRLKDFEDNVDFVTKHNLFSNTFIYKEEDEERRSGFVFKEDEDKEKEKREKRRKVKRKSYHIFHLIFDPEKIEIVVKKCCYKNYINKQKAPKFLKELTH